MPNRIQADNIKEEIQNKNNAERPNRSLFYYTDPLFLFGLFVGVEIWADLAFKVFR